MSWQESMKALFRAWAKRYVAQPHSPQRGIRGAVL